MQLYIYDHCPFCVRVRMILGYRNIAFSSIVLLNDDEETPINLVGKKIVPILIKDDGQAMIESMDIVHYIDELSGEEPISRVVRPEILNWVERSGEYLGNLYMPRTIQIGLEEFATQSAIDYYLLKKTALIGDFDENIANTKKYIIQAEDNLAKLATLISSTNALNEQISEEDIIVFPLLRALTIVKNLQWPEKVRNYVEQMSQKTRVPLYFDRAI